MKNDNITHGDAISFTLDGTPYQLSVNDGENKTQDLRIGG